MQAASLDGFSFDLLPPFVGSATCRRKAMTPCALHRKDNGDPNPSRHGRRGQFIGKMGVVANRLLSATARGDGANFHRASRENGDQLAACRSEHNVPLGSSNDHQPINSSITDLDYSLMRILIPVQRCSPTIPKSRTSRQMVAFSIDRTFP
jgi:hypothetical protein